jgi:hypothetical protein
MGTKNINFHLKLLGAWDELPILKAQFSRGFGYYLKK